MDFCGGLKEKIQIAGIFLAVIAGLLAGILSCVTTPATGCCVSTFEKFWEIRNECVLLRDLLGSFATLQTFENLSTTNGLKAIQALDSCLAAVASNDEVPTVLAENTCQAATLDFRLETIGEQLNTLNTALLESLGLPLVSSDVSPDDRASLWANRCKGFLELRKEINEIVEFIKFNLNLWKENFKKTTYIYNANFYNGACRIVASLGQVNDWLQAMPTVEDLCSSCQDGSHPNKAQTSETLLVELEDTEALFTEIAQLLSKTTCFYCNSYCSHLRTNLQNLHHINQALKHAASGFATYQSTQETEEAIVEDLKQGATNLCAMSTLLKDITPNKSFACVFRGRETQFAALDPLFEKLTTAVTHLAQTLNPEAFTPVLRTLTAAAEEDSCQGFEALWTAIKEEVQELVGESGGLKTLGDALTRAPFMTTDAVDKAMFSLLGEAKTIVPVVQALSQTFTGGCSHGAFSGMESSFSLGLEGLATLSDACSYATFWRKFTNELTGIDGSMKTIAAYFHSCVDVFQNASQEMVLNETQKVVLQGIANLWNPVENPDTPGLFLPSLTENVAPLVQEITDFFIKPHSTDLRVLRPTFLGQIQALKDELNQIANALDAASAKSGLTLSVTSPAEASLSSIETCFKTTVRGYRTVVEAFNHLGYDAEQIPSFTMLSHDLERLESNFNGSVEKAGLVQTMQKNAEKLGHNPPLPCAELSNIAAVFIEVPDEHKIMCHACLLAPIEAVNLQVQRLKTLLSCLASNQELFVDTLEEDLWMPIADTLNAGTIALGQILLETSPCAEEGFAAYLLAVARQLETSIETLNTTLKTVLPYDPLGEFEPPAQRIDNNCASLLACRADISSALETIHRLFGIWTENFTASGYTRNDDLLTKVRNIANNFGNLCQQKFLTLESFCTFCEKTDVTPDWKTNLYTIQDDFKEVAEALSNYLCCPPLCVPLYEGNQQLGRISQAIAAIASDINIPTVEISAKEEIIQQIGSAAILMKETLVPALEQLTPTSTVCPVKKLEGVFQDISKTLQALANAAVSIARAINPNALVSSDIPTYTGAASCEALTTLWKGAKTQLGTLTTSIHKLDAALFEKRQFAVNESVEAVFQELITAFNGLLDPPNEGGERRFEALAQAFAKSSKCTHSPFKGFDADLMAAQTFAEDLAFKVGFSSTLCAIDGDLCTIIQCLKDFDERFQVLLPDQVTEILQHLDTVDISAMTAGVQTLIVTLSRLKILPLREAREKFLAHIKVLRGTLGRTTSSVEHIWTTVFEGGFLSPQGATPSLVSIQNHVAQTFRVYAAFVERFKHAGYEAVIGEKLTALKVPLGNLKSAILRLAPLIEEDVSTLSPTLSLPYKELGSLAEPFDMAQSRDQIECHALLLEPFKQIRRTCAKIEMFLTVFASTDALFVENEDENWLTVAQAINRFLTMFNGLQRNTSECVFERAATDLSTVANLLKVLSEDLENAFSFSPPLVFTDLDEADAPTLNNCASLIWCRERITNLLEKINDLFPVWTKNFEQSRYTYREDLQTTVEAIATKLETMIVNVTETAPFPSIENLCSICEATPDTFVWRNHLTATQKGFSAMADLLKTSPCCGYLCPSLRQTVYQLKRLNQVLSYANKSFGEYLPTRNSSIITFLQIEIIALTDLKMALNALMPSKSALCPFRGCEGSFETLSEILKRLVDAVADSIPVQLSELEPEDMTGFSCDVFKHSWEQIAEQLEALGRSLNGLNNALACTDLIYDAAVEAALDALISCFDQFLEAVDFDALHAAFTPQDKVCYHEEVFGGFQRVLADLPSRLKAIQTTLSRRCCTLTVRTLCNVGSTLSRLTDDLDSLATQYRNPMLEFETDAAFSEWSAPTEALGSSLEHLRAFLANEVQFPKPLHVTIEDWLDIAADLGTYTKNMDAFLERLGLKKNLPPANDSRLFESQSAPTVLSEVLTEYIRFSAALDVLATTLENDPPLHANIPLLLKTLPTLGAVFSELEVALSEQAQMKWLCFESEEKVDWTPLIEAASTARKTTEEAFGRLEATLSVPGCCLVFARELFQVVREGIFLGKVVAQTAALGEVAIQPGDVADAEDSLKGWGESFDALTDALKEWKKDLDAHIMADSEATQSSYCFYKETSLTAIRDCTHKVAIRAQAFAKFLGASAFDAPEVQEINKAVGCQNVAKGVQALTTVLTGLKASIETILMNFLKPTDRTYFPSFLEEFHAFGDHFQTFCTALATLVKEIPVERVCQSCAHSVDRERTLEVLKRASEALPPVVKGPGSLDEAWTFYDDSTLNKRLIDLVRDAQIIAAILEALGAEENSAKIFNCSFHNAVEPSLREVKNAYMKELDAVQTLKKFLTDQGREALILNPVPLETVISASAELREKMEILSTFVGVTPTILSTEFFDTYYHNTDKILEALAAAWTRTVSPVRAILGRMKSGASYNTPKEIVTLLRALATFDGAAALDGFGTTIHHRLDLQPAFDSLKTTARTLRSLFTDLGDQFEKPTYFIAVEAAAVDMGKQACILTEYVKRLIATSNLSQEDLVRQLAVAGVTPLSIIVKTLGKSVETLHMPFPQDQTTVDAVAKDLATLGNQGFSQLSAEIAALVGEIAPIETFPSTMIEAWAAVETLFETWADFFNQRLDEFPVDFVYQNESFLALVEGVQMLEALPLELNAWGEAATDPSCVFEPNIARSSLVSAAEAASKSVVAAQHLANEWQAHCCDTFNRALEKTLEALEHLQYALTNAIDKNPSFSDHLFRTQTTHPLLENLAGKDSSLFSVLSAIIQKVTEEKTAFEDAPNGCYTGGLVPLLNEWTEAINHVALQAKALYEEAGTALTWPKTEPLLSTEAFWPRALKALGGLDQTAACIAMLHQGNTYEVDFDALMDAFERVARNLTATADQIRTMSTSSCFLCAAKRTSAQMPLLAGAVTLDDIARHLMNLPQKRSDHCQIFLEKEAFLVGLLKQAVILQQTILTTVEERIAEIPEGVVEPEDETLLTSLMELETQMGTVVAEALEGLTTQIREAETLAEGYLSSCHANLGIPFLETMIRGVQDFVETGQSLCACHSVRLRLKAFVTTKDLNCVDRPVLEQELIQTLGEFALQWNPFAMSWKSSTLLHHRQTTDAAVDALQTAFEHLRAALNGWTAEASNVCLTCKVSLDLDSLPKAEDIFKTLDAVRIHAQALCPSVFQRALDRIGREVATMAQALSQTANRFENGFLEDSLGVYNPLALLIQAFSTLGEKIALLDEHLTTLCFAGGCVAEVLNPWAEDLAKKVAQVRGQIDQIATAAQLPHQTAEGSFETLNGQLMTLAEAWEKLCNVLDRKTPDAQRTALAKAISVLVDPLEAMVEHLSILQVTLETAVFCNGETGSQKGNISSYAFRTLTTIREATQVLVRDLGAQNCCDAYATYLYQLGQSIRQVTVGLDEGPDCEAFGQELLTQLGPTLEKGTVAIKSLRQRLALQEGTAPACLFEACAEEFQNLTFYSTQLPLQLGCAQTFPNWNAFSFEGRNDCDFLRDLYKGLQKRLETFFRTLLLNTSIEKVETNTLDDLESVLITCSKELDATASTLTRLENQGMTACMVCSLGLAETARRITQMGATFCLAQEALSEKRRFEKTKELQRENEAIAVAANIRLGATEEEQALRPIVLRGERPRETTLEAEARLVQAENEMAAVIKKIWG